MASPGLSFAPAPPSVSVTGVREKPPSVSVSEEIESRDSDRGGKKVKSGKSGGDGGAATRAAPVTILNADMTVAVEVVVVPAEKEVAVGEAVVVSAGEKVAAVAAKAHVNTVPESPCDEMDATAAQIHAATAQLSRAKEMRGAAKMAPVPADTEVGGAEAKNEVVAAVVVGSGLAMASRVPNSDGMAPMVGSPSV